MPTFSNKKKSCRLKSLFREIFVCSNREIAPFGTIFIYTPENYEQQKLGTLFGIIKVSDNSPDSSYVANLLASVIKKEYFSKPDRPAGESFEASLRKANLALAELAHRGLVSWTGKINFIGGALEKNNLHFSKLGTAGIILLRSGMIADISAGMDTDEKEAHPLKTFSNISSGKLEKNDCLVAATSDLFEIFSLEEIRQNAARFSRDEFPKILSASLATNSELAGAIVINLVTGEEEKPAVEKKSAEKARLRREEPAVSEITFSEEKSASPKSSIHIDIPPIETTASPRTGKTTHLYVSEAEEIIPKKTIGEKILALAKKTAGSLQLQTYNTLKKIISFARCKNFQKIFSSLESSFSALAQMVRKIDWQKKNVRVWAAAGIAIAAVVFFSAFKIFSGRNVPTEAPIPPQQTTAPAAMFDDINVKNIENIEELASLPQNSRELVFLADMLYVLSEDKSILAINPVSGEMQKLDASLSSGKFQFAAAMPDLKMILIFTADKKIISFTPANKNFQENNIILPENLNTAAIKTYLTYLYIFDSKANQIYRYPRAEGGFGEQQSWLKPGADIREARSFAINEKIFATSNNQITAYSQGKKDESINFENPAVPLTIDKIFSVPNIENIYVLDNKNHRIVQYSKEGKIIAQYFNTSISDIKDFTIDEKNKIVYLQKDNSILKFNMETE